MWRCLTSRVMGAQPNVGPAAFTAIRPGGLGMGMGMNMNMNGPTSTLQHLGAAAGAMKDLP